MRKRASGRATDRELRVVEAVLASGSEKAAAHRLGLSHSTVKHHLANARSKLSVDTTAQLVWILAPRLPAPVGAIESLDLEPGAWERVLVEASEREEPGESRPE